ncbi:AAA family ATPase [Rhodococcus spongiicola]|uniref:AAA family ATPase n=1 Tax=Rhodococcus spongiicola TaxID=2487352 RepID=UPI0013E342E9|nr:AAA family ATPase [Rhodococcus spongiicola]
MWNALELAEARQVDWLAAHRLPSASVSYMVGPEGIGKSLFLVWLTAVITTGKPFPAFGIPARNPQTVVLVLTEDDWATVARPRLEVAGADLAHVRVICEDRDGSGTPTFPLHMDVVADASTDAALVIVDAWADTLPGGQPVKDPQNARKVLHPWKELATRTGVAVLLTGHTNREKGSNVRNAYGLTGEIRKKARMTVLAQPDPDEDGVLVIGPEKSNLTAGVPASKFQIRSVQVFDPTDASDGTVPCLEWIGDANANARDFYADAAEDAEGGGDAPRSTGQAWLEDFLTEAGKATAKEVKAAAAKADISLRTLQRAAKKVGVVYTNEGFPRVSHWSLPQSRHE